RRAGGASDRRDQITRLGGLTTLILNISIIGCPIGSIVMPSVLELRPSARIYPKVRHAIPRIEWPAFADVVDAFVKLKKCSNSVVLAHNYQTPEIFHGVADIVGDSLALARKATEVDADVIVLAGVHFMAETAKLLNPSKTVLIPDTGAGCSLADSITPEDVRL